MPVFMPCPPTGLWMCAASPSRNARPLRKLIGDPMVHAVGREPVHALDVDAHPFDHALAHVVPRQVVVLVLGVLAHCADQPRAPVALQREDGEKIGRVQRDVQLAVHRRPRAPPRRRRRRDARTSRPGNRSAAPRARVECAPSQPAR